jgi:ABC-type transporter Mla MlaB component
MNKAAPGKGLLNKLALFVRHPTTPWSDLDRHVPPPEVTETLQAFEETVGPQERSVLQAALQAKRRNDAIRQEEFNLLRQTREQLRAQAAVADPVSPATEAPVLPAGPPSGAGKLGTIEKIARIEAQMVDDWPERDGAAARERQRLGGGVQMPATLDGGVTQPAHLQARAQIRDQPLPIEPIDFPAVPDREAEVEGAAWSVIEEAAVRFASGDEAAAGQVLRAALAQQEERPAQLLAWHALLDWCHARGDLDAFEETAAELADQCGVPVPRWPGALPGEGAGKVAMHAPASTPSSLWRCPPFLDLEALQALQAMVAQPGADKWVDWNELVSADAQAAEALLALAQSWAEQPLVFHFGGGGVLRRRLKASTPSGRRENEAVWWHLRLAMLRLMHRVEEFDLVALDFCVTYGVVPPVWSQPASGCEAVDRLPGEAAGATVPMELAVPAVEESLRPLVTQLGGLDVMEWPAMATDVAPFPAAAAVPARGAGPVLAGVLQGDLSAPLAALQQASSGLAPGQTLTIDCRALRRLDFAAAGSLLQWLLATQARGLQVELAEVNRLVAGFFHVVGIDEAVMVRLRQY